MMMRLVLQPPPGLQILASILILAVSVLISFWAVAKIFRVGILMTGKRMTLPEILRWLRAA
jgi:ABC-2 type transport system permease protein